MKLINAFILLTVAGTATAFTLSMSASPDASSSVGRRSFVGAAVTGVASIAAAGGLAAPAMAEDDSYADFVTTESGMKYKVLKEGTGAIPLAGQTVKAHYTGWLDGFDSIRKFDSSRDRSRPFTFAVGKGQVIRGWDEAFSSMKIGERRQIVLPARLAYGDRGAGGIIPGGATLYFDVELLGIL
jgi:peptidylprolyl isomerase